jgi:quinol monooxygenase YgiN
VITITAVIRVKPGAEPLMRAAFADVIRFVRDQEPEAVSFFITAGLDQPNVFTTYERFVDRAAMEAHNAAGVVQELHRIAKPVLDGPVLLEIGEELFAKNLPSAVVA